MIKTLNDNGTGMKYSTKEEFMNEISELIDTCMSNGGTYFSIDVEFDKQQRSSIDAYMYNN